MTPSDSQRPEIGGFVCRLDYIVVLIWFASSIEILGSLRMKIDPDLFARQSNVRKWGKVMVGLLFACFSLIWSKSQNVCSIVSQ